MLSVASCSFCPRKSIGNYTLTRLKGNPRRTGAWRRVVAPLCDRCDRLLTEAGREGRVLKGTRERWFGGHGVGIFEPKGRGIAP